MTGGGRAEEGQAAVELALLIPFVVLLLLAVVQVTLVARDQILVVHAAREAARQAAVDPRPGPITAAALRAADLEPHRTEAELLPEAPPGIVKVQVRYRSRSHIPLLRTLVPELTLAANAAMRMELDTPREKLTALREK